MQPSNQPLADGVQMLCLPDRRFKTMQLTVALLLPLDEQTASTYALLPFLLRRSCAAYPDYTALQRRLDQLYGARITADVGRVGDAQMLTLTARSLKDELALDGEPIAAQCADLLCRMLFAPALEDGAFRTADVEQEKRCLIEMIASEINEKRLYARRRCEELLCPDEPYAVPRYGRVERVAALTPQELTAAWKTVLATARVQIIVQGGDGDAVARAFRREWAAIDRHPVALSTCTEAPAAAVREQRETMEVNQSKLVMGFRLPVAEPDGDVAAARLMVAIFGGTPHSLLFRHVRERLSLCYYCSAGYDRLKGVMLVDSGVQLDKVDEARAEILRQLDAVRRGDFTDEDMASAKRSLTSQFESVPDLQSTLAGYYLGQSLLPQVTPPADAAEAVAAVTRERVMAAAQQATLRCVYLLAEKGGEGA